MNLRGQEGRAEIILTPHPQSLSPLRGEGSHHRRTWENLGFTAPMRVHCWRLKLPMNPGDPHLTLALSPPIRWERRGNPPSPRLRRTGSKRMAAVARKSGRRRQVQGFKARIFRGKLSMNRALIQPIQG